MSRNVLGAPFSCASALVIASLFLCSCQNVPSTKPYVEILDRSARISVILASVLPPQEVGWHYSREHAGRVILGKLGSRPGQSYSGMVVLTRLPVLQSKEEFYRLASSQRARDSGDPRFEDLVREESVSIENGSWVFRFHIKYKDFGARNLPPSVQYLLIEDFGASFRHPDEEDVAVTVALSQRSMPEDALGDFEAKAERFIQSVEFHPASSEYRAMLSNKAMKSDVEQPK